jgi:hypothetical protein
MEVDLQRAERSARRAYERARLRRSLLAAAPLLAVVVLVCLIGSHHQLALPLGGALFSAGVLLLWRGQQLGRGVLPGAMAGLIPLALSLLAQEWCGACSRETGVCLCVPACALGGLLAGGFLACFARRAHRTAYWLSACGVALLTGALGCSCAGHTGILGLAGGMLLPFLLGLIRASRGGPVPSR